MSSPREYEVSYSAVISVTINNPDVVNRCVENHNDEGVPVEYGKGLGGWRDTYYPSLDNESAVVLFLAENFGASGTRVTDMDGWGDLDAYSEPVSYSVDLVDAYFT